VVGGRRRAPESHVPRAARSGQRPALLASEGHGDEGGERRSLRRRVRGHQPLVRGLSRVARQGPARARPPPSAPPPVASPRPPTPRRPRLGWRSSLGSRRAWLVGTLVLALAATRPGGAQNSAPESRDRWSRREWPPGLTAQGQPQVTGYVHNTTNRRAVRMRL